MEEMCTGYVTGMSVATHIKGKLALIGEVYLSVWERCGYGEDASWFFIPSTTT